MLRFFGRPLSQDTEEILMRRLYEMKTWDPKAAEIYEEFRKGFLDLVDMDKSCEQPPGSCVVTQEQKMQEVLLRYSVGQRAQAIRMLLKRRMSPPH